jgi:hypothetical protein
MVQSRSSRLIGLGTLANGIENEIGVWHGTVRCGGG